MMVAAEKLIRDLQDRLVPVQCETFSLGLVGVYSSVQPRAEKPSVDGNGHARGILVELGRRRIVGGQEDMMIDVALGMGPGPQRP
jgi:4-hydroxy 2-oxovalerate aldolase